MDGLGQARHRHQQSEKNKQVTRSSNYYSATLKNIVPQAGYAENQKPVDATERDVLACQLAGHDSIPRSVCDLYDESPSRDLWKALLLEWHRQAHIRCTGVLDHYYMKCTLDRLFAIRKVDHGTISWWPTNCPSYTYWYDVLYPKPCSRAGFSEGDKFQILCAIYRKLNATKPGSTTFPDALAQTCWKMKATKGRRPDA